MAYLYIVPTFEFTIIIHQPFIYRLNTSCKKPPKWVMFHTACASFWHNFVFSWKSLFFERYFREDYCFSKGLDIWSTHRPIENSRNCKTPLDIKWIHLHIHRINVHIGSSYILFQVPNLLFDNRRGQISSRVRQLLGWENPEMVLKRIREIVPQKSPWTIANTTTILKFKVCNSPQSPLENWNCSILKNRKGLEICL